MALSNARLTLVKNYIFASIDPAVVSARTAETRNDGFLRDWLNSPSNITAWAESVNAKTLFESMDISKFDGLTAGKREAWRMMLDFAPLDFGVVKNRKAITDQWGNVDSIPILQAVTRFATNFEVAISGNDATTNTVTAKKLTLTGPISLDDVSNALDRV